MSAQPVIDGFDFAKSGKTLQGSVPFSDLPRLSDLLNDARGALDYAISGVRDGKGRLALRVRINGALRVKCQRCLEALELPVAIDSTLALAGKAEDMEAEPLEADGADWVLAGKDMNVGELLEDELLLAVPYAPRHERCGKGSENSVGEATASPFAGLRSLMGDARREKSTKQG